MTEQNQITESVGWNDFRLEAIEAQKQKQRDAYAAAAQANRRRRVKDPGRLNYIPSPMGR